MRHFQPEKLAILFQYLQGLLAADAAVGEVRSALHASWLPPIEPYPSHETTPTDTITDSVTRERQSVVRHCYAITSYLEHCTSLELTASVATIKKINRLATSPEPQRAQLSALMEELLDRLRDELEGTDFFSLTTRESALYSKPLEGWAAVVERFPQTVGDVEEASKCLALSRYAAAVFHSVQAVEVALIELGKFIGVNDPHSGWTAVEKRLKSITSAKYQDRTAFENANFAFLEQVHATTESLKNAWRNKISHAQGRLILMTTNFSPEVAEEILFATRSFMRRLADGLPRSVADDERQQPPLP